MPAEVFAGISAFKGLVEAIKALKEMADTSARTDAIIEIQSKLMTAQSAYFSIEGRCREVEEKLARLEAWEGEKQRYELAALYDGALAYRVKEAARGAEPVHHLCTNCYGDGKKSIMQGATSSYSGQVLTCPRCKSEIIASLNYDD